MNLNFTPYLQQIFYPICINRRNVLSNECILSIPAHYDVYLSEREIQLGFLFISESSRIFKIILPSLAVGSLRLYFLVSKGLSDIRDHTFMIKVTFFALSYQFINIQVFMDCLTFFSSSQQQTSGSTRRRFLFLVFGKVLWIFQGNRAHVNVNVKFFSKL